MERELTLGIVKPGAVTRMEEDEIVQAARAAGLEVAYRVYDHHLTPQRVAALYAEHVDKDFYPALAAHMTSGPCTLLALAGEGAVGRWRELMGPADPRAKGDGLRQRFGTEMPDNAVHGSATVADARRELALLLPNFLDVDHHPQAVTAGGENRVWPEDQDGQRVHLQRVSEAARLPSRGSAWAAGLDVYASEAAVLYESPVVVKTGWKVAVPRGFELEIRPRSGLSKHGIRAAQGTVDADYRGELLVTLFNDNYAYQRELYKVAVGDRVAQILLHRVPTWGIREVSGLDATERGEAAHGSTGR